MVLGKDYTYKKKIDKEFGEVFVIKFDTKFVGKIDNGFKDRFVSVLIDKNQLNWKGGSSLKDYLDLDTFAYDKWASFKEYIKPDSYCIWSLIAKCVVEIMKQIKQLETEETTLYRFEMIAEEM